MHPSCAPSSRRWLAGAWVALAATAASVTVTAPVAVQAATPSPSAAASPFDPLQKAAALSSRAHSGVLLSVARAGDRIVAVGERGTIVLSDDQGQTWRQAPSPVSVALTRVSFADAEHGWAVGHGQVVLASQDGGQTWTRQLDGLQAAKLEMAAAQADPHANEDQRKQAQQQAQRLLDQGADKPFLDVHFFDRQNGLVVGAYGAIFATRDGGKTWRSRRADVPNPSGRHLNHLMVQGKALYLAGEQGTLFQADGPDQPFKAVQTPYAGTFFGVMASRQGDLLAYGLRGNVWRSAAGSGTWEKVATPAPVTLTGGTVLADGRVVLVDEAGKLLVSRDHGQSFAPVALKQTASFTDVVQARDGSLVLSSARGALHVPAAAVAADAAVAGTASGVAKP